MKILDQRLRQIWYADSTHPTLKLLTPLLFLTSLVYRTVINIRNRMYDHGIFSQRKLPCKVVSVGNIAVGGTGKTPMVIMLAKILKEKGYRPAVLSRGYGGRTKHPVNIVSDGSRITMGCHEAGDEPVLIARATEGIPVITGAERSVTGKAAINDLGANILILDDGFQHRKLFRDLDIVILNREEPFGNGFLLPRGPLREPPKALDRAHFLIWKDSILDGRYPKYQEKGIGVFSPTLSAYLRPKTLVRGESGDSLPLEYLRGKKICAFAGIAFPESFRETIESMGGIVVSFLPFPDHHNYTVSDIADIERVSAASTAEIVMTTEKDGIRLNDFTDFLKDIFILRVEMEVLPSREEFEALILEKLK
ncbi:MAG: tetraacyldisaccharide 4'-kinase [Deltaproteobacteria bacterium]|nr:tetraacyldisaccharide 4'-kinase [Deltaproteobacteria bacterium]